MKGKLYLLILLAFLLCGCSANVNITINDNTINERISIVEYPYDGIPLNDIKLQYRKYIPAFKDFIIVDTMPDEEEKGVKYYRASGTEMNGSYNAYYQYDFNFLEYSNATSVNKVFRSPKIEYDKNAKKIIINTDSSELLVFSSYPQLDEVKVNISTNYKVLENNADSISGNVYTWVFRKGNQKGLNLVLEDKEGKSINEKKVEEKEEEDDGDVEDVEKKEEQEKNSEQQEKSTSEKIREEGTKHPGIVIAIAIGFFFLVVFILFNVKKV